MDPQVYNEHIEQEQTHWWFVSRRIIIKYLLKSVKLNDNAKILDAGCGAGGNLEMLSKLGSVSAFEMNDQMREHSIKRNIGTVAYGKIPEEIPFAGTGFDLITLFDVLEHIEDDGAALSAISERLNKNGILLITVPAFQSLFSKHDKLHHHFRRYSKSQLQAKIKAVGLEIEYLNYWNVFLFPVAAITRLLDFLSSENTPVVGSKTPSRGINNFLIKLVSSERFLSKNIAFPFGLSLILIARKR